VAIAARRSEAVVPSLPMKGVVAMPLSRHGSLFWAQQKI
jgi:hypothetical protein